MEPVKVTAVAPHRSNYPNPIGFRAGESVSVTRRRDDEFPGWIWVRTPDGNEGWAPEEYLAMEEEGAAIATTDYSARELNTDIGEILVARLELNGWLWCSNAHNDEGWVPAKTVTLPESR